jgi:hypothetical protein
MENNVTCTINCNYSKAELFITYKHNLFQVCNSSILHKSDDEYNNNNNNNNNNTASISGYFYFHKNAAV